MKTPKILLISALMSVFCYSCLFAAAFPYNGDISGGFNGADNNWDSYIDFVIPLAGSPNSFLFLSPRASMTGKSIFGSAANEINIGIGFRKHNDILFDNGVIAGINAYYDTRNSRIGNNFQQLGAGIEFLSDSFDFRLNGYVPFGNKSYYMGKIYNLPNEHHLAATHMYEVSLFGIDTEIGYKLPVTDKIGEIRIYAGYYHFDADTLDSSVTGAKGRIEYRPLRIVRFNYALYENSDFNGSSWQAGIDVNIPLDFKKILQSKNPFQKFKEYFKIRAVKLKDRIGEKVIRDMYVRTNEFDDKRFDDLLKDEDGTIYHFTVISENGTGDGTFENPASLENGLALNKAHTGPNATMFLYGGSYLRDSEIDLNGHQADSFALIGYEELRYMGGDLGKRNKGNPVIRFAAGVSSAVGIDAAAHNKIKIAGIEFSGTGNNGTGLELLNYSGSSEFMVRNNNFSGFDTGIKVVSSSDTVILRNNIVSANNTGIEIENGSALIENNIIRDNLSAGLYLNKGSNIEAVYNYIENNGEGIKSIESSSNTIGFNSLVNNTSNGIFMENDENSTIIRNEIFQNKLDGIYIKGGKGSIIDLNIIYENEERGILVSGSSAAVITDNLVTMNKEGIKMDDSRYFSILKNDVRENTSIGINLYKALHSEVLGNSVLNNKVSGILSEEAKNVIIGTNAVSMNGNGIEVSSSSLIDVSGNEIYENTTGILMSDSVDINIASNTVSMNGYGMSISGIANLNAVYNDVYRNKEGGIYLAGGANLTFIRNNFNYNEGGNGGMFITGSNNILLDFNSALNNESCGIGIAESSGIEVVNSFIENYLQNGHGILFNNASNIIFSRNSIRSVEGSGTTVSSCLYLLGNTTFSDLSENSNILGEPSYNGDPGAIESYERNVLKLGMTNP